MGSVSSSNAAKCSVGFLNKCSNQQVCYRSTKNKGSVYHLYVFESNRRGLVCSPKPLFTRLPQAERIEVQTILSKLGYYSSDIDGLYGKGTAAALKAYNKEYLNNADLTKSSNVKVLLDDLLKEKPAVVAANKCQGSDTKSVKCRPITIIPRDEQAAATEQVEATEPEVLPPLDFAKVKASYDAGNFSQAFEDAQTLSVEGNPDAQHYLGKMYADGRGTLQVTTSAHMWFNIASMNGSDEAFEERKTIQSQMTPEHINEAQKMAVACIKSDYKDCGVLVQPSEAKVIKERELHQKPFQPTSSELRSYFVTQPILQRKQIQYALKQLGYYGSSVDGLWGKGTKRAVEDYLLVNSSINGLDGIYESLTEEVEVPSYFENPAKQQISVDNSNFCESLYVVNGVVSNPNKEKEARRRGITCGVKWDTSSALSETPISKQKSSGSDVGKELLKLGIIGIGCALTSNPAACLEGASGSRSSSSSTTSPKITRSSGCSSDFQCSMGEKCVKKPYSNNGVCMKTVNRFGGQTYSAPSASSVRPRMGGKQCRFLTDCPIGFQCDMTYKVCVK